MKNHSAIPHYYFKFFDGIGGDIHGSHPVRCGVGTGSILNVAIATFFVGWIRVTATHDLFLSD